MSILDKLKELFAGGGTAGVSGSGPDPNGIWLHFRCDKCAALVRIRADKRNDFNREDDGPGTFLLRKEVMDSKCFQLMDATVWLGSSYNVVTADVTGGELITQEEYEAAQASEAKDSVSADDEDSTAESPAP